MPFQPDLNLDWRQQKVVKRDGIWLVDGRPPYEIEVAWQYSLANSQGKQFIGHKITGPVNSAAPSHTHGGAAVCATVIQGRVLNQMICADGQVIGPKVYEKGESWYEAPGCHHVRCENAGDEETIFIAAMVVDGAAVEKKGPLHGLVLIDAAEAEAAQNEAA